MIVENKIY